MVHVSDVSEKGMLRYEDVCREVPIGVTRLYELVVIDHAISTLVKPRSQPLSPSRTGDLSSYDQARCRRLENLLFDPSDVEVIRDLSRRRSRAVGSRNPEFQ
jgi:hypothetical protein